MSAAILCVPECVVLDELKVVGRCLQRRIEIEQPRLRADVAAFRHAESAANRLHAAGHWRHREYLRARAACEHCEMARCEPGRECAAREHGRDRIGGVAASARGAQRRRQPVTLQIADREHVASGYLVADGSPGTRNAERGGERWRAGFRGAAIAGKEQPAVQPVWLAICRARPVAQHSWARQ